jgi:HD-like signal output (HDOD) protein
MIICIVDDEERISLALKTIIGKALPAAEIICFENGMQAYQAYKDQKVDLILSDWNMPVMSGKELLSKIRLQDNDFMLPFLMLTARADADSVRDAISSGVTEYIAKPFDKDSLLDKIFYLLKEKIAKDDPTKIQKKIIDLIRVRIKKDYVVFPILPEIGFKAVEVINSDNVSMNDVADVVKIDTALSGKILSLANSIHYRSQQPLETLEDAMARVGARETMNAVLIYAMKELYKDTDKEYGKSLRRLWESALITALISRELALALGYDNPDKFYTAGMFYDVGKLMILPVLMELKQARSGITPVVVSDVMHELNKEIGVALLKHWGFSALFIEIIKTKCDYSDLSTATNDTMLLILASSLGCDLMKDETNRYDANIVSMIKNQLNLSEQQVETAQQAAKQHISEIKSSLLS